MSESNFRIEVIMQDLLRFNKLCKLCEINSNRPSPVDPYTIIIKIRNINCVESK